MLVCRKQRLGCEALVVSVCFRCTRKVHLVLREDRLGGSLEEMSGDAAAVTRELALKNENGIVALSIKSTFK